MPILLIAMLSYVAFGMARVPKETLHRPGNAMPPVVTYLIGGLVPAMVTLTMVYLFMVRGAATTVQFNVGSSSRMQVWSSWVDLFLPFYFLTAATGTGYLIATVCALIVKRLRHNLPCFLAAMLLNSITWLIVVIYHPSA